MSVAREDAFESMLYQYYEPPEGKQGVSSSTSWHGTALKTFAGL